MQPKMQPRGPKKKKKKKRDSDIVDPGVPEDIPR